jgi:hypothetical protein
VNFIQEKIIELYADRERLILIFENEKCRNRNKMITNRTDNKRQINLIIDEILREHTILSALISSLNERKTDINSLRLEHVKNEIEHIKVKITGLKTKILLLGSE